jgi:heme exporter protein A
MTLSANALVCERNGRVVFSNLSFEVKPGQCAELRGANGAGKSSLLRLIAGLVPVAAGDLTLDGNAELSTRCHYAGHQDGLKSALTVAENLRFWANCFGGENIESALSAFSLAGLRDEHVQILSAGQKRRLSLARLMLVHRPLWLLDEPMTALDAKSQSQLRDAMQDHLKSNGMIVVATHGDLGFPADHLISLGAP